MLLDGKGKCNLNNCGRPLVGLLFIDVSFFPHSMCGRQIGTGPVSQQFQHFSGNIKLMMKEHVQDVCCRGHPTIMTGNCDREGEGRVQPLSAIQMAVL